MARLVLRGEVTDKLEPRPYEAFGNVPAGTSYRIRVREDDNVNQAALVVRCNQGQYDALSVGDKLDAPVFVSADRKESRDGRVFADLGIKIAGEHVIAARPAPLRAAHGG